MNPLVKKMFLFGAGGATISLGTLYFVVKTWHQGNLESTAFGHKARVLFYSNDEIRELLGTPIKESHPDVFDVKKNFDNGYETEVHIPVQGSKTSGYINYHAKRKMISQEWKLDKLCFKPSDERDEIIYFNLENK